MARVYTASVHVRACDPSRASVVTTKETPGEKKATQGRRGGKRQKREREIKSPKTRPKQANKQASQS